MLNFTTSVTVAVTTAAVSVIALLAALLNERQQRKTAFSVIVDGKRLDFKDLDPARLGGLGAREAVSIQEDGNPVSAVDWRDALAATEADPRHRPLAEPQPDVFRPNLALSLNNLANRLSEFGQWEEALEAAQEAATLYRALAEQHPDAFRPSLAMSLNTLANVLSAVGQTEAALEAAQESTALYRALAGAAPGRGERF